MNEVRRHPGWIWTAVVVLAVLHQDFWWWSDRRLVLGVMPIGLAYHAAFSIAAATVWAVACRWAWPDHIEEWAEGADGGAPPATGKDEGS